jgi:diguanylate cyclase (GGDEF)-like protein
MKKKNVLIISIIIVILAIIGVLYFIFTNEDSDSTLTLVEKQWIESNKNTIIDFGFVNDVAILNNSGEGIVFNFIEKIEEDTGIDFNKVSYKYGEDVKEDYAFKVVDKVSDNDILIYTDNYVLIGKKDLKYNNLDEISNATVGVLKNQLDNVNNYLVSDNLKYKAYEDINTLLATLETKDSGIDYIVLPKLVFLSNYANYNDLYINYNITELVDNYVISLGDTKKLNNILTKYYKKWSSENYNDNYATEFTNLYFELSDAEEQAKVKFRSKRYVYGFVENAPFDIEVNGKLVGINSSVIKKFADLANVEVTFDAYSSVDKLRDAFASGDIDLYFDKYSEKKYDLDVYSTVSPYDEQIVVVSNYTNDLIVNSVKSLKGVSVITLGNTMIEDELKDADADIKTYDDVSDLLAAVNNKSVVVLDKATYDFYKNSTFENFKVDYQYSLDGNYSYMIRDIKNNEVFENFFNYYLAFTNETPIINTGYYNAVNATTTSVLLKKVATGLGSVFILLLAFLLGSRFMPNKTRKRKTTMRKEDKLRYVDMLTSLKNRNYLNDNIETWDASEVYPQSIIILDLNNIAYINDNYGHQEGDEVIRQAANILITNQIPNSDIIRTNGNEFLIYMVEYDEKQVANYIKKLNKEFKELAHGFGAAIGYSMITDGIKTIDDAVNEATLDMRNNKEELNN